MLENLGVVSKSTVLLIRKVEKLGKDKSGVLLVYHRDPKRLLAFARNNNLDIFRVRLGGEGVRIEK